MSKLIYGDETYQLLGKCYDVHRALGPGFLEIVYKDALEYEFNQAGIKYARESRFDVWYKGVALKHYFVSDFTAFGKVIIEIKSCDGLNDIFKAQAINYLKVSGFRVALLVNFGQISLEYKRLIL